MKDEELRDYVAAHNLKLAEQGISEELKDSIRVLVNCKITAMDADADAFFEKYAKQLAKRAYQIADAFVAEKNSRRVKK